MNGVEMTADEKTAARVAEPMSEASLTDDELLRAEQTVRELVMRDGKYRPSIRVLLMQIDRQRAVVAERDGEIERLYESIERRNANLRAIYDLSEPGRYAGAMDASELAEQIRLAVNRGLLGLDVPDER